MLYSSKSSFESHASLLDIRILYHRQNIKRCKRNAQKSIEEVETWKQLFPNKLIIGIQAWAYEAEKLPNHIQLATKHTFILGSEA